MCKTDKDGNMPLSKYLKTLPEDHPAKALFGTVEIAPERTRGSFFTRSDQISASCGKRSGAKQEGAERNGPRIPKS